MNTGTPTTATAGSGAAVAAGPAVVGVGSPNVFVTESEERAGSDLDRGEGLRTHDRRL